jgi:hypothetical protein
VKPIAWCSTPGCGLLIGYDHDGAQICWFHAEQEKLPAHTEWRREFAAFLRTHADELQRTSTKRDNYGVLGHG